MNYRTQRSLGGTRARAEPSPRAYASSKPAPMTLAGLFGLIDEINQSAFTHPSQGAARSTRVEARAVADISDSRRSVQKIRMDTDRRKRGDLLRVYFANVTR